MFVLNSPFMQQQSKALAQRLLREAGSTPDEQIDYTYRLVFGRSPSAVEVEIGRQVLPAADAQLDDKDRLAAWQRYSHALLSSNEFYFVD